MKRKYVLIIIPAVLILTLMVVGIYALIPFEAHRRTMDTAHKYESQTMQKAPYTLVTERADSKGVAYATFVVRDSGDIVIYRCPDKYRTYDLKSIDWAEDTYDIVVTSGDVGEVTYLFSDDTWAKKH